MLAGLGHSTVAVVDHGALGKGGLRLPGILPGRRAATLRELGQGPLSGVTALQGPGFIKAHRSNKVDTQGPCRSSKTLATESTTKWLGSVATLLTAERVQERERPEAYRSSMFATFEAIFTVE